MIVNSVTSAYFHIRETKWPYNEECAFRGAICERTPLVSKRRKEQSTH